MNASPPDGAGALGESRRHDRRSAKDVVRRRICERDRAGILLREQSPPHRDERGIAWDESVRGRYQSVQKQCEMRYNSELQREMGHKFSAAGLWSSAPTILCEKKYGQASRILGVLAVSSVKERRDRFRNFSGKWPRSFYMFSRFSSTSVRMRSPSRATSNGFLNDSLNP
jgi:hypothetical protein